MEYKAARYTVQRPCQIGAAIGGGDDELYFALGAYGSPLGRAFQFRDDCWVSSGIRRHRQAGRR